MNGLLYLSIGLTAVVGSLCTILYSRLQNVTLLLLKQSEQVGRLEVALHESMECHREMQKRLDSLATDVLQREIYQSADDRHQIAIQDAKNGLGLHELVNKHGLSSDEAALIIALHAKPVTLAEFSEKQGESESFTHHINAVVEE